MPLLRPACLTLLLLCAIGPVAEVLHREVTLGLLILLGLIDAGRGTADADSATEQLGMFLRRLASLAVWPFHLAVVALAFLGLSAHEHGAEKRLVPVCATCSGSGSSGCGSAGGGCGASGSGKCGCGSGKTAGKPAAVPAPGRDTIRTTVPPAQSQAQSPVPGSLAPQRRPGLPAGLGLPAGEISSRIAAQRLKETAAHAHDPL